MRYRLRVEALEQTQVALHNRICVIYQDEDRSDTEAQIAAWRAANDGPDDAQHPLQVIRVVYVDPKRSQHE